MNNIDPQILRLASLALTSIQRTNGYLARKEVEEILEPLRKDAKRLEPFGFKVYSQNDEDGILDEIFKRLGITDGKFVEIGVENGLECNSLYLLHRGWHGAWIEGNDAQRDRILNKFSQLISNGRLELRIEKVFAETINNIFRSLLLDDTNLDFLSIDIDGNDIYLFQELDVRPKVICIEYNGKWPADVDKAPTYDPNYSWSGTDYMGSSLLALDNVARAKGFVLVGTNITGSNAFFVRNDLVSDLFPFDSSVRNLFNPARYWLTFDCFSQIGHRADFGPYVDLSTK